LGEEGSSDGRLEAGDINLAFGEAGKYLVITKPDWSHGDMIFSILYPLMSCQCPASL
jgi:hypothetical protein